MFSVEAKGLHSTRVVVVRSKEVFLVDGRATELAKFDNDIAVVGSSNYFSSKATDTKYRLKVVCKDGANIGSYLFRPIVSKTKTHIGFFIIDGFRVNSNMQCGGKGTLMYKHFEEEIRSADSPTLVLLQDATYHGKFWPGLGFHEIRSNIKGVKFDRSILGMLEKTFGSLKRTIESNWSSRAAEGEGPILYKIIPPITENRSRPDVSTLPLPLALKKPVAGMLFPLHVVSKHDEPNDGHKGVLGRRDGVIGLGGMQQLPLPVAPVSVPSVVKSFPASKHDEPNDGHKGVLGRRDGVIGLGGMQQLLPLPVAPISDQVRKPVVTKPKSESIDRKRRRAIKAKADFEVAQSQFHKIFETTGKRSDQLPWKEVCERIGLNFRQSAATALKKTFGEALGRDKYTYLRGYALRKPKTN